MVRSTEMHYLDTYAVQQNTQTRFAAANRQKIEADIIRFLRFFFPRSHCGGFIFKNKKHALKMLWFPATVFAHNIAVK